MDSLNLLFITSRKNTALEPEIELIDSARADSFVICNPSSSENIFENDTVSLNGKTVDIMGNLTDEQIEAALMVEQNNASNEMFEVFTTCDNFSDKSILNICATNPAGAPSRLRIIRPNVAPTVAPTEAPTEAPTVAPTVAPTEAPTEVPTETPTEAPTEAPEDIILTRKSSTCSQAITISGTEQRIKLTNCVDGKDYYYTISSTDGASHNINIEILDNDNFLIIGNYIKLVADEGQDDSLIIMGGSNEIYTNSGNDIIRLNDGISTSTTYTLSPTDSSGNLKTDLINNKIYAGSGDDYIISGSFYSSVDGGGGDDTIVYTSTTKTESEGSYGCTTSGVENKYDLWTRANTSLSNIHWAGQNGYYDCQFLSWINALRITGKLGDFVKVTQSGSTYTVQFLKSGYSQSFSANDINSDGASGDLMVALIEHAFLKCISVDGYDLSDDDDVCFASHNWLLSKYLYGMTSVHSQPNGTPLNDVSGMIFRDDEYETETEFKNDFKMLLEAYKSGQIGHLIVGTQVEKDLSLGIDSGHAYTVIDGEVDKYVVLVNPWDYNDKIKLDWDDFFKYFQVIELFGDSYEYACDNSSNIRGIIGFGTDNTSWNISLGSADTSKNVISEDVTTVYTDLLCDDDPVSNEIEDISNCIDSIKEILDDEKNLYLSC